MLKIVPPGLPRRRRPAAGAALPASARTRWWRPVVTRPGQPSPDQRKRRTPFPSRRSKQAAGTTGLPVLGDRQGPLTPELPRRLAETGTDINVAAPLPSGYLLPGDRCLAAH